MRQPPAGGAIDGGARAAQHRRDLCDPCPAPHFGTLASATCDAYVAHNLRADEFWRWQSPGYPVSVAVIWSARFPPSGQRFRRERCEGRASRVSVRRRIWPKGRSSASRIKHGAHIGGAADRVQDLKCDGPSHEERTAERADPVCRRPCHDTPRPSQSPPGTCPPARSHADRAFGLPRCNERS